MIENRLNGCRVSPTEAMLIFLFFVKHAKVGPISIACISGKQDEHLPLGRGLERNPIISS